MALSRLQNFLNNPTGVQIFVDSGNFDATDSIENRGTSPGRPFFSLQRALIEAALYSFQPGKNNDRIDRTTIIVSPGTHYIDNRPGLSIQDINGQAIFKKKIGKNTWQETNLQPFGESTNFDIFDPDNDLYKYNSVYGGVILPRGTSIVGQDLRKTKIRPLYVPDPLDNNVERSSILNVTGSCYFSQFTFFDADNTKFVYKNYNDTKHVPKFSHHKLTTFVYADGVNKVRLGLEQTDLTDLEMYYYKVTRAYDSLSGRGIEDFPTNTDLEPNINEFRIVGALQENPLGISSIRAGNGDGTGDNSIITITTANLQTKIEEPHNFAVDTPIIIKGITESPNAYNGSFAVREVVGVNTFTVVTTSIPSEVLPNPSSFDTATVSVESDTVTSSSPYIFNCSLRSVYGMCGMWADGSKSDGFKSMVVAQFTGVSLQKDNDAYAIYDGGVYYDNITLPSSSQLRPLYQNSKAIYKPDFENFHIKCSNDAFIQAVSVFAIGYAKHFVTESGADMSITNSNSNFGANSLNSVGFKKVSFDRDDTGYITHIIPPKELILEENDVSWLSLDISKIQTIGDPSRLYIFGFSDRDITPAYQVDGYRIGARVNDKLYLTITGTDNQITYAAPIFMPTPGDSEGLISKKEYKISRNGIVNNISNNTITLTESHKLFTGEKVRIFSDNCQAPEGLDIDKVYYAITSSVEPTLSPNEIRLATTLNDAISNQEITGIANNGGIITVISSVSDKEPGDFGHPVQWDETARNWFIKSSQFTSQNEIYGAISTLNPQTFGRETPTTFVKRIQENRSINERLYKLRYVIPKEYINAKPPQLGYILQESKNVAISTISVNEGTSLLNSTELRNDKVIINITPGNISNNKQLVTVQTELPHNFIEGDIVKIQSVKSTNNPSGVGIVSTYNGEHKVISIPSSRTFTYELSDVKVNPGTFTNNVNQRTTRQQRDNLPLVSRQSYKNTFYIYRVDTIRDHVPGQEGQDGIYHLVILSSSIGIGNNVGYGLSEKYFNQDIRNLYPQIDRDNPVSNPNATISYADLRVVGNVITDDKKKSITLEALNEFNKNTRVGFGITNIALSGVGNTTLTIFSNVEHKLNSIKSVNFVSNGVGYPVNTTIYSANLLDSKLNEEDATCKYSTTAGGVIDTNTFRFNDVGSAHTVGEQLSVDGASVTNALVSVTEINNNIGDGLELSGFYSTELNGVYEIVGVPNKKAVQIFVPQGVSNYIPNTSGALPIGYIASKGVGISSVILSDLSAGIATVTTSTSHGLNIGNKFKFTNSNLSFYNNKDFIVSNVVGVTTFTFNVGVATTTATPSTGKILKYGISSNSLNLGKGEENLASRACYIYSGLECLLTSPITINSSSLNVNNSNGLNRGDFIIINNEILRISSNPVSNSFNVLRNQLGTVRTTATVGATVKKVRVLPTEIRRPSFMRASGHTFEYLGYGPGNYSTALPQRQDRILTDVEVLVSQAKRENGGSIVYTGMNDLGEFYTGSKKVSATTGEETIIGAPILTYTGDDANGEARDKQSGIFDEILVRERISVEGGENNNQSSQFYGPVSFSKKVTNLSDEGILTKNFFVRGTVSQEKLITVGISTPTANTVKLPVNGDISLVSNPVNNYIGHVFKSGEWRQWGPISNEPNKLSFTVDKIGVGVTPSEVYPLNVTGTAQIQNLRVTGGIVFTQPFNLGDVKFENVDVYGTMTFLGISPITGLTTNYTQIHERGTSRLNQLEVVGVTTFTKNVYINQPDEFGIIPTVFADKLDLANIRIGIANTNTIDTKFGDLRLKSNSGRTVVNTNLLVADGNVAITTTRNIGVPNIGVVTAYINNSSEIRLGVGNTNQESYIEFNNDGRVFPDYALRLIRSSGIGSQSSSLIHRGSEPLFINASDSADIRILTDSTERVRIGSSGTVTSYHNNSGENLRGGHIRLTQAGSGDIALSWDITNNNLNRRWYSGIDVSSNYSWKLATPSVSLAYGNENFDTDTKLEVDVAGNLTLTSNSGITSITGSSLSSNITGTFNLYNTNVSTANIFGSASTINLGSDSGTITLRNPTLVGTSPIQNVYNSVATTVNAFGAASSLNLGGSTGTATIRNPILVGTSSNQEVYNVIATSVNAFGAASTLNIGGSSGTLTLRNPTVVGSNQVQNLYNSVATTVNAFGEATTINFGNTTNSSTINVRGSTQSTSTSNGALVVSGGVGVAGNLNVGGNITAASLTGSASTTTSIPNLTGDVTSVNTVTTLATVNSTVGTFGNATNIPVLTVNGKGLVTNISTIATIPPGNGTLNMSVSGIGLSGSATFTANQSTNSTFTITSNATNANTANTIVSRDANGNFSAGTIIATLNGNANTASIATNVVGTAGRILYNSGTNATTTSANLLFDGTNLTVGGDITAFASDIRLKTNIKPIENALDKVSKLNGFTYTFNELGEALGFDINTRYAGVSAQEVREVLPEVVKEAPASSEYITVQYEKLVPLLIEAIKELKVQIKELKTQ